MSLLTFFSFLFFSFFFNFSFGSPNGDRILVILDNLGMQQSYSLFFNEIKSRGYKLSFFAADDPSLSLTEFGEYLYDHIIFFAPTAQEFSGLIDIPSILDFIDEGHNLLLAADSDVSDPIRDIATECGVEFDDEGFHVLDHFHPSLFDDHTILSVEPNEETTLFVPVVTGNKPRKDRKPVLFSGIGQTIPSNALNFGILRGYDTTYASNPSSPINPKQVTRFGKETILISALQARNNARVLISGSLLFFSDRFFKADSDNQYLATELSKWVLKERGLLRAGNVTHNKVGETETPSVYRIKDDIEYSVHIEEFNGKDWIPFQAKDVQLEFTMIDPYIRKFLSPDKKGNFKTSFKIPDVYGVFTFKLDYHQIGYSTLSLRTTQSVRPYRHDEYERFIRTANPYYLGCASMLVGVFVLFVFLLFSSK